MILNKAQIKERLFLKSPPMVRNIKDLSIQLQPLALDLTIAEIFNWGSAGRLDFDNSERLLSERFVIRPDNNYYYLKPGSYQILLNELFNMPLDIAGFTTSRSSLQRCGATIERGFFDPGFVGEGVSLLIVMNSHGIYLKKEARIAQMEFHLIETTEGYNGIYKRHVQRIKHNSKIQR